MDFFSRSRLFEKIFVGIVFLTLWCFGYYFTTADIEETESRFTNKRSILVKLLSREIGDLLNRRENVEPRLATLLAEESVAYAILHQLEGEIVAQVSGQVPMEVLRKIEEEALKATHLKFIRYYDPAKINALVEAVVPIFTQSGKKFVLRVGFFRNEELEKSRQVLFRNILIFTTLLLGFVTYWFIRRRGATGLQATWLGGTGILMLLLFLSVRFTIQEWYDKSWRLNFIQQGFSTAKFIAIHAKKFLQDGDEGHLKEILGLIETDENYVYMAVVKDEQYVFHSNPNQKGKAITNPDYIRLVNTETPFPNFVEDDLYEAIIPVLEGQKRLGTFILAFQFPTKFGPLIQLRNRIMLIFLVSLILALFLVYMLSKRISKDISLFIRSMEQVTAGDLRQSVYLDRNDEFGQLAQAYNFMLMGLKERDLLSKGLQNYVSKSIVDRTLKVLSTEEKTGEKIFAAILFIFFEGLEEAIAKNGITSTFSMIRETFQMCSRIGKDCSKNTQIFPTLHGINMLFFHPQRHESLMMAVQSAQKIMHSLEKMGERPFRIMSVLHGQELIHGAIDDQEQLSDVFFGEGIPDFKALVKANEDLQTFCLSEEVSFLLKDVAELEEISVVGSLSVLGKGSVFKNFKSPETLIKLFPESNSWNKIMILKLLKSYARDECVNKLIEWFSDPDSEIRAHIMDTLERLRPPGIIDFIIKVVNEEKDPRVLSKAIRILGKIGNESHINILAEKLRTDDRRVKANTIEALEAIGGKKVYEFLNLLIDEQDNRVKANILIALGKYGDLRVFDLLSRMIKDPDKSIRASAAYALGKLGMVQGVEPLVSALSDKDLSVRRQVIASLSALKADLEVEM